MTKYIVYIKEKVKLKMIHPWDLSGLTYHREDTEMFKMKLALI